MKFSYTLLTLSVTLLLTAGCSNKQFSLQTYADKYFNNKTKEDTVLTSPEQSKKIETTNPSLKQGPASDIAWSRTYKNEDGALQKGLDQWIKEDWDPSFEGNNTQTAKDANATHSFTLQHYYDKSQVYLKKQEDQRREAGEDKEPAHYEKVNALPVIGK